MPAPAQDESFQARLAWGLVGLILAWAVAQGALLQFGAGSSVASAANAVFLLGVGVPLLAHELAGKGAARLVAMSGWRADLAGAAAGLAVQLLLGVGVIAGARVAYVAGVADPVIRSLAAVATVNIVLLLAGLTPALPMDGGRILRAAIWGFCRDPVRAARAAAAVSEAIALIVVAAGLASAVVGDLADAWPWLLIGAVVWGHARAERGREPGRGRPTAASAPALSEGAS